MAGPVKDREAFQRLSFLYQVRQRCGRAGGPVLRPRNDPGCRSCPQAAHCVLSQNPENQALARFYCHTEKTLVLRQDPSVKRTLCRGCSSLLIPGLTCTQRQRREC
ncbi:Ribonuclease P protein subunit p21 [Cricetulus griseus]|uniref:Ribonuclease P protein subunit p21 n=1 Tax=Cricetulus griseus TaxID=10029 RepID=G3IFM2_CRIGR|nr:Ribonuclease P protein subunit p21 [Cricetulus griseus]